MVAVVARVAFAGSRDLSAEAWEALGGPRVVRAVLRAGREAGFGCAVGADALALAEALAEVRARRVPASSLAVFAAFGLGGLGAWPGSAVAGVRAAAAAGVPVRWAAGGRPDVRLLFRLRGRTKALVAWAALGGPGSALVVCFAGAVSPGSCLSVRLAAAAGLPVFAFVAPGLAAPPLCWGGAWVPAGAAGVWAGAWRFVRAVVPPCGSASGGGCLSPGREAAPAAVAEGAAAPPAPVGELPDDYWTETLPDPPRGAPRPRKERVAGYSLPARSTDTPLLGPGAKRLLDQLTAECERRLKAGGLL